MKKVDAYEDDDGELWRTELEAHTSNLETVLMAMGLEPTLASQLVPVAGELASALRRISEPCFLENLEALRLDRQELLGVLAQRPYLEDDPKALDLKSAYDLWNRAVNKTLTHLRGELKP